MELEEGLMVSEKCAECNINEGSKRGMTNPHQADQNPPSTSWIGYPPSLQESGTQTVQVSAGHAHSVCITMFLLVNTESGGQAGRQYSKEFHDPQSLWDFLHQLPRETQTVFKSTWDWEPPKARAETKTKPHINITLEDLDL
jgi:hypothetical protein